MEAICATRCHFYAASKFIVIFRAAETNVSSVIVSNFILILSEYNTGWELCLQGLPVFVPLSTQAAPDTPAEPQQSSTPGCHQLVNTHYTEVQ